jgi:hypothetical protein
VADRPEPVEQGDDSTPDSETAFELGEIDESVERLLRSKKLGALGQLTAALIAVVVLGLILLGVAALASWLFQ